MEFFPKLIDLTITDTNWTQVLAPIASDRFYRIADLFYMVDAAATVTFLHGAGPSAPTDAAGARIRRGAFGANGGNDQMVQGRLPNGHGLWVKTTAGNLDVVVFGDKK